MLYKTITLQLLQDHPQLYDQLLKERMLLPTLEQYATELKELHETWKMRLAQVRPWDSDSLIASEALELALRGLQQALPAESPDESEHLSLDAALAFLSNPTSPA